MIGYDAGASWNDDDGDDNGDYDDNNFIESKNRNRSKQLLAPVKTFIASNPVIDKLFLKYIHRERGVLNVRMFNLRGQKIFEEQLSYSKGLNSYTISAETFEPGILLIQMENNTDMITSEVVVRR